jgi:Phosphotransferase enzyme family
MPMVRSWSMGSCAARLVRGRRRCTSCCATWSGAGSPARHGCLASTSGAGRCSVTCVARRWGPARRWPGWVHTDDALVQVGEWLRRYHGTVRDFVPAADAVWRIGTRGWQTGDVIGHNDAAPYNAVWVPVSATADPTAARLVGFIDWDFACPCPPIWDLTFTAFSWAPLHARDIAAAEGFSDFDA